MSRSSEVAVVLAVLAIAFYLGAIAERLCEMEPKVTVQFVPQPESRGDRAAAGGSE